MVARVEHAGLKGLARAQVEKERAVRRGGLTGAEAAGLVLLFQRMPSRVGLRSNLGSQLQRMQSVQSPPPLERRAKDAWRKREARKDKKLNAGEVLAERAQIAEARYLAGLPAKVRASLDPLFEESSLEERPTRSRYLCGAIIAKGYKPETMLVKMDFGGGGFSSWSCNCTCVDDEGKTRLCSCDVALEPMEAWADISNSKDQRLVAEALRAIVRMVERGQGRFVSALYRIHGQSVLGQLTTGERAAVDRLREANFPSEAALLAVDTEKVKLRAAKMQRELRTSLAERFHGDADIRRETVTPQAGLTALLSDHDAATDAELRAECLFLLREASNAFRKAST